MKRIISFLLVLVLVLSMVACAESGSGGGKKKTTTGDKTDVVEISRGTTAGTLYKNEILDFIFTRPSSWVYSTDEEIAMVIGVGAEMLEDDRFQVALDKNAAMYDMMVVDMVTQSNVIVGYENLKMSLSSNITEEQYIENLKKQLNSVSHIIQVEFVGAVKKVKLGETEFTRVVCKTTTNGVTMTQVYYVHKVGSYMGMVIATITDGYTVADIEAMFK